MKSSKLRDLLLDGACAMSAIREQHRSTTGKDLPMEYKVHLSVSSKSLPVLIQVIEGTAGIRLVDVALDGDADTKITRRHQRYANGKRNKGISSLDLAIKVLGERNKTSSDILEKAFVQRGFSERSVSPTLSRLRHEKKLINNDDGTYSLKK